MCKLAAQPALHMVGLLLGLDSGRVLCSRRRCCDRKIRGRERGEVRPRTTMRATRVSRVFEVYDRVGLSNLR